VILQDRDVESLSSFIGIDGTNQTANSGRIQINLKPRDARDASATRIIARLQDKLASTVPGITLYMQPVQDLTVENRVSRTQYQYTLEDADPRELVQWTDQLVAKLRTIPALRDIATDQTNNGLAANLVIDRDQASRLGVDMAAIDNTLYDAFGQRQVSTIFTQLNQYHVVLEVDPQFRNDPASLDHIYVASSSPAAANSSASGGSSRNSAIPSATSVSFTAGANAAGSSGGGGSGSVAAAPSTPSSQTSTMVPLSAFSHFETLPVSLASNHQGQFPVVTISFNVAPGLSLGQAVKDVTRAQKEIGTPPSVHGSFQGTARAFEGSLANEGWLILAAIVTVYIVLGVLYESYIHPVTILSTLPSAGVGAIIALYLLRMDLGVISLIGIILLIGIVKKNAIMMIDFALDAERNEGKPPDVAIYEACLLRFRPIMMTTMAALFGAVPLAFGSGTGSELRRPLGVTIIGGLLFSQILTLYTTPVVYLWFDRLGTALRRLRGRSGEEPDEGESLPLPFPEAER
jgi:multidrug efflux pump